MKTQKQTNLIKQINYRQFFSDFAISGVPFVLLLLVQWLLATI